MIKTSRQLKALIGNQAKGNSGMSQLLIRNYAMERFLERISLSDYKDNFILKGGMLISSMVGLENRATMDIDTTVRNLPLDIGNSKHIIEKIISVPVNDNIRFVIKSVTEIMDEAEYSGVRLSLDAYLDTMRIPLKIDISTGDVITPSEITYQYKLMFEERYISLWAYTLETVLAEKIETILYRALTNTRLRDFYDLYILQSDELIINRRILAAALTATSHKRNHKNILLEYEHILDELEVSRTMRELWDSYQKKNSYAEGISWNNVIHAARNLCKGCIIFL